MSDRLNPREDDLGELRNAVQEMPRNHAPEDFTVEDTPLLPEKDRAVPVEPANATGPQPGTTEAVDRASEHPNKGMDDTATDDVERYLRSCHRRGNDTIGESRAINSSERNHRSPDRSNRPIVQTPDTFLAELSGVTLTKPYLERLPDAYSAQLEVFEWLDRMLSTGGQEETVSALEYYEAIGWLSGESREELEEITAGLPTPDITGERLDINDHRESLLYVARLSHRLDG